MAEEKKAGGGGERPKAKLADEPHFNVQDAEVPEELPDEKWSTERLAKAVTTDGNMLVRSNAVMHLAKRDGEEAIEALVQALKDPEHLVKSNAMIRLAEKGQAVTDRMVEALGDVSQEIRSGAAWILGEIKDERAVEPLKRAVEDESALVRVQAKATLMAMGLLEKKEDKRE